MRVADGDRWVKGLMVPLFTTPLRLSIVVFSMMLHETYSRKSPSRGSSGLHWHGAIDGPNAAMSNRAMRTCSYIVTNTIDWQMQKKVWLGKQATDSCKMSSQSPLCCRKRVSKALRADDGDVPSCVALCTAHLSAQPLSLSSLPPPATLALERERENLL